MGKKNGAKQRLLERKKAEAEHLKAMAAESDIRDALRAYLCELFGVGRGNKVWGRFWKVRCHHLWEDSYRINFWVRDRAEFASPCRILYSFFARYTELKGFFDSQPDLEESLRPEET